MGGVASRFRLWRSRRRLIRLLRDDGWRVVFTGNVVVTETVYAPGMRLLTAAEECQEFADYYVKNCSEPKEPE